MMRNRKSTRKSHSSFYFSVDRLEVRLCLSTNPALVYSASQVVKGKTQVDLFLTTANGAATTQLTNDKVADWIPVWSPDGARIAFLRDRLSGIYNVRDLHTIKPDGTGLTLLLSNIRIDTGSGNHMDWSPDGKKIAYGNANEFWVLDVASGAVQDLVPRLTEVFGSTVHPRENAWSPDLDAATEGYQGKFAFGNYDDRNPANPSGDYDIMLVDVTIPTVGDVVISGPVTNLTNTDALGAHERNPRWSPDGQFIAYHDEANGYLTKIRTDGTGKQALTTPFGPQSATWSPDSRYIAWGGGDVFRIRADGTGKTNLTNTAKRTERYNVDWNPKWVNDLGLTAAATAARQSSPTVTGRHTRAITSIVTDSLVTSFTAEFSTASSAITASSALPSQLAAAGQSPTTDGLASTSPVSLSEWRKRSTGLTRNASLTGATLLFGQRPSPLESDLAVSTDTLFSRWEDLVGLLS